jgi:hypothetical protein
MFTMMRIDSNKFIFVPMNAKTGEKGQPRLVSRKQVSRELSKVMSAESADVLSKLFALDKEHLVTKRLGEDSFIMGDFRHGFLTVGGEGWVGEESISLGWSGGEFLAELALLTGQYPDPEEIGVKQFIRTYGEEIYESLTA